MTILNPSPKPSQIATLAVSKSTNWNVKQFGITFLVAYNPNANKTSNSTVSEVYADPKFSLDWTVRFPGAKELKAKIASVN